MSLTDREMRPGRLWALSGRALSLMRVGDAFLEIDDKK